MNTDLADITFEHITGPYHWGMYGPFKVIIDRVIGYINATQLCGQARTEAGNRKQLADWRKIDTSKALISELIAASGIPLAGILHKVAGGSIIVIRGTYVHPKLIVHIAIWADPPFALKVSDIVNAHFRSEYLETIRAKDDKIGQLMARIDELLTYAKDGKEQLAKVRDTNEQLCDQVEHVTESLDETKVELTEVKEELTITRGHVEELREVIIGKEETIAVKEVIIDKVTNQRVIPTKSRKDTEILAIYHMPGTQYCRTIRRQLGTYNAGVELCERDGYTKRVCRCESPNSVNLGKRLKEVLPKEIGSVSGSIITLFPGKTVRDLSRWVRATEREKKVVANLVPTKASSVPK